MWGSMEEFSKYAKSRESVLKSSNHTSHHHTLFWTKYCKCDKGVNNSLFFSAANGNKVNLYDIQEWQMIGGSFIVVDAVVVVVVVVVVLYIDICRKLKLSEKTSSLMMKYFPLSREK